MLGTISTNMMEDRADIYARYQFVEGKIMRGERERVLARNVPCKAVPASTTRHDTEMGYQQREDLVVWMDKSPPITQGLVFVFSGNNRTYRYVVQTVEQFPSPHDFVFQVAHVTREMLDG